MITVEVIGEIKLRDRNTELNPQVYTFLIETSDTIGNEEYEVIINNVVEELVVEMERAEVKINLFDDKYRGWHAKSVGELVTRLAWYAEVVEVKRVKEGE